MRGVVMATMCPGDASPLAPWGTDCPPYPCSVQGLGAALGEVWQGGAVNDAFIRAARGARVVIVNGNTELVAALPEIAGALRGSGAAVAFLQEGDARPWDALSAVGTAAWLAAARAADVLLLYNDEHAADWTMMTGTPSAGVVLPAPSDAADGRLKWIERGHAIHVGSAPGFGRGGMLSLTIARAVSPSATVYAPRAHYRREETPVGVEGIIAASGATMVPWEGRVDFLARLARCRLAVNLDGLHTYGRFAADCAALGVPCVGYDTQPAQRILWPDLTISTDESAAEMVPWLERALVDPILSARLVARADAAAERFAPEAVQDTFWKAMAGIP